MARQLASLARKPVASDLLATLGGRGVQMLLALVGSIISARVLGPVEFGLFGLVMATIMICGTIADAGLTYTAVKFISQYAKKDPRRAHDAARSYFSLKTLTGMLATAFGYMLAEPIARFILGQPDLAPYLQFAFLTLFSLSISSYPGAVLTGLGRFRRLSIAAILNAAITLGGILYLFYSDQLDLTGLIVWNVLLPLVSTLPAWLLLPAGWLPTGRSPVHPDVLGELLGFSKWMWVSNIGSMIAAQADVILLGRLAGPAAVGVYSVALTLAMRLDTLNQSLLTVMLPRASRLQGPGEIRQYTRRAFGGSLVLACLLGLVALLAQPLIVLLYGERYTASAGLFLALMPVVLFDLITSSLFLIALPLNRPRVLAIADWLRVGTIGVACWLLIPAWSAYGAAAARLISRVTGAAYTFYALRHSTRSSPDEPE